MRRDIASNCNIYVTPYGRTMSVVSTLPYTLFQLKIKCVPDAILRTYRGGQKFPLKNFSEEFYTEVSTKHIEKVSAECMRGCAYIPPPPDPLPIFLNGRHIYNLTFPTL